MWRLPVVAMKHFNIVRLTEVEYTIKVPGVVNPGAAAAGCQEHQQQESPEAQTVSLIPFFQTAFDLSLINTEIIVQCRQP